MALGRLARQNRGKPPVMTRLCRWEELFFFFVREFSIRRFSFVSRDAARMPNILPVSRTLSVALSTVRFAEHLGYQSTFDVRISIEHTVIAVSRVINLDSKTSEINSA